MNKHDISNYSNPDAVPNLDRYNRVQRLNSHRPFPTVQELEDAEQMRFVEQWNIDHPDGGTSIAGYVFLVVVGLAMVAATMIYIKNCDVDPKPRPIVHLDCSKCHMPPLALNTYSKYTKHHKIKRAINPANDDAYIMSHLAGGK